MQQFIEQVVRVARAERPGAQPLGGHDQGVADPMFCRGGDAAGCGGEADARHCCGRSGGTWTRLETDLAPVLPLADSRPRGREGTGPEASERGGGGRASRRWWVLSLWSDPPLRRLATGVPAPPSRLILCVDGGGGGNGAGGRSGIGFDDFGSIMGQGQARVKTCGAQFLKIGRFC
jgi:hypothetical protein